MPRKKKRNAEKSINHQHNKKSNRKLKVAIPKPKKAEEKIFVTNERLKYLLSTTSAVIYSAKTSDNYAATFISENVTRMTGYQAEEFIRNPNFWIDHVHPEDKKEIENAITDLFEYNFSTYEYRFLCKDGSYIWVNDEMRLVRDEGNKPIEIVGYWLDITGRKKVEEALRGSEEKYRNLVENANDAIFSVDSKTGTIIDANKRTGELLGMSLDTIIGRHHTELYPKEERHLYKHIFDNYKHFKSGNTVNLNVAYVEDKEGNKIPVQISTSTIILKDRSVVLSIVREIGQFMTMVDTLREEKLSLKKAIGEKECKLREALKELENSRRLSDIGKLAATVAHELRNPLAVIRTAAYNIRSKKKDSSFDSHLNNIDKKILESDRIINNLLSYSRMTIQQREYMDIMKLLNGSIMQCKDRYPKKDVLVKIKNRCDAGLWLEVDPVHINELFSNILDNAYQSMFSDRGLIEITVDCNRRERRLTITFRDDGIGMSKKDLTRAFDPFFTTKTRGIGLGLTVCRQVVELYDGSIDMESKEGKRTTITVKLPFEEKMRYEPKKKEQKKQ